MESAGLEPGRQGAWGGERVRKTVNSSLRCCLGLAGMYPEAPLCTWRKLLLLNFVPLVPLGTSSQISPQLTSPNYYMYIHIIYIYIDIYIYLWLHWVFVTEHRLSWVVGGASLFLPGCGISLRASHCSGLSHCRVRALANSGFSSCGLRAQSRSLVVNCTGLDTLLKPNTQGQTLYDFICIRYLKRQIHKRQVTRGLGERRGYCLMGKVFHFGIMKTFGNG